VSAHAHATTWQELCEWRVGLIYPATREQAAPWRKDMRRRARQSGVPITTGHTQEPIGVGWAVLDRPHIPDATIHAADPETSRGERGAPWNRT
jgi:hypothetical protein